MSATRPAAVNPTIDPQPAPPLAGAPTAHDPAAEAFAALDTGFDFGASADAAGFVVAPAVAVKMTAQDRAESILSTLPPDVAAYVGAVVGHADRMLSKSLVTGARSFDVTAATGRFLTFPTRREATAVAATFRGAIGRVSSRLRCASLAAAARKVPGAPSFKITFTAPAPPAPRVVVDPAALLVSAARRPAVVVGLAAAAAS